VLIAGGGSGGCFAVWRLDMVGSEGIKLVCNGENGRRTETQSGISICRIVWGHTIHTSSLPVSFPRWICRGKQVVRDCTLIKSPLNNGIFVRVQTADLSLIFRPAITWVICLVRFAPSIDSANRRLLSSPVSCIL
jgi:hypothetical protein